MINIGHELFLKGTSLRHKVQALGMTNLYVAQNLQDYQMTLKDNTAKRTVLDSFAETLRPDFFTPHVIIPSVRITPNAKKGIYHVFDDDSTELMRWSESFFNPFSKKRCEQRYSFVENTLVTVVFTHHRGTMPRIRLAGASSSKDLESFAQLLSRTATTNKYT